MTDSPHPIDVRVGRAVRQQRKTMGVSQEQLATAIGVSFQQLQKYERGSNRISASKLWEISKVLGVAISSLFGEESDDEPLEPSMLVQLHKLSPTSRVTVLGVAEALAGSSPQPDKPQP